MTIFLVYMYLQYTSVNDYFRLKCQNLYVSKYESLVKILASKNFVVYAIMHVHDQTAHIHVFSKVVPQYWEYALGAYICEI